MYTAQNNLLAFGELRLRESCLGSPCLHLMLKLVAWDICYFCASSFSISCKVRMKLIMVLTFMLFCQNGHFCGYIVSLFFFFFFKIMVLSGFDMMRVLRSEVACTVSL